MVEHNDDDLEPHLFHRGGIVARHEPDTLGTLLAVARVAGLAPPTKISMLPSVWDRICRESNGTISFEDVEEIEGVKIEIDQTLPLFPGYQIHREVW